MAKWQKWTSMTITGLSLAMVAYVTPAMGATVITQEFDGIFSLQETFGSTTSDSLPESAAYSGFVTYAADSSLQDWQIDIDALDLNLDPNSTLDSAFQSLTPTVNFELDSASDWSLAIDFGIAFDAPRYTLSRNSETELEFVGELGLAGGYIYSDMSSNISLSQDDSSDQNGSVSNTSVPEPATIFGTIFVLAAVRCKQKLSV